MTKKKYKKPKALYVTISGDVDGLIDLEFKVVRGGTLSVELSSGEEDDSRPAQVNLPGGVRDQRRWVCEPGSIRPLRDGEPWRESTSS